LPFLSIPKALISPEYGQNSAVAFWIIVGVSVLYSLSSLFGIVGGVTVSRLMNRMQKVRIAMMLTFLVPHCRKTVP
jgi:hypothetical protein